MKIISFYQALVMLWLINFLGYNTSSKILHHSKNSSLKFLITDIYKSFHGEEFIENSSTFINTSIILLNPIDLFRMGLFGAAHEWGVGQKDSTHISTMMKLSSVTTYPMKFKKTYKSCETPIEFCWHQHFSTGISNFCYIKKYG